VDVLGARPFSQLAFPRLALRVGIDGCRRPSFVVARHQTEATPKPNPINFFAREANNQDARRPESRLALKAAYPERDGQGSGSDDVTRTKSFSWPWTNRRLGGRPGSPNGPLGAIGRG